MNLRRCGLFVVWGAIVCLSLTGCDRSAKKSGGKKVVLATTGMIGDLARRVAGDTVEIQEVMKAGVDPHEYQPTTSDTSNIARADLVLYNGLHLEGKMVSILEKHPRAKAVARNIPPDRLLSEEGQSDPHIWFDVTLWTEALNAVEKDLRELEPNNAELYTKNAATYRQELEQLHQEVKRDLAQIPKAQRVFITAHDAFLYFGRAYDVEVHGLQGISTSNQAGEKRVQQLVDRIVSQKIKAVFVETSVSDDGVNAVIERCKARGYELKKADGSLFSDAMGEPNTPEGTYPGMIRHNVRIIVNALK